LGWDYLPYAQNLGRILIHLTVLGYLELVGFSDHNYTKKYTWPTEVTLT